jgi:integrase
VSKLRQRKTNTGNIGLAPWSIRNYLVVLKSALKWAAEHGFIARAPRFPKVRVPRLRPQPVLQDDYLKLLAAAPDPEWKAYMMCGWWAGLRMSEAKNLRRSESRRWPYVAGNRIVLPADFSKSNRDDWVPLHKELAVAIDALPADTDEFFPNIAAISRRGIGARISKIAKAAGVRLSMHKLRKGFGCRIAKQLGRGDAPVLHRLMRHSSMQLTMDFYASTDDALEDRMRMLT